MEPSRSSHLFRSSSANWVVETHLRKERGRHKGLPLNHLAGLLSALRDGYGAWSSPSGPALVRIDHDSRFLRPRDADSALFDATTTITDRELMNPCAQMPQCDGPTWSDVRPVTTIDGHRNLARRAIRDPQPTAMGRLGCPERVLSVAKLDLRR